MALSVRRRFLRKRLRAVDRDLSSARIDLVKGRPDGTILNRSIAFDRRHQEVTRINCDRLRRNAPLLVRVIRAVISNRVKEEADQATNFRARREGSLSIHARVKVFPARVFNHEFRRSYNDAVARGQANNAINVVRRKQRLIHAGRGSLLVATTLGRYANHIRNGGRATANHLRVMYGDINRSRLASGGKDGKEGVVVEHKDNSGRAVCLFQVRPNFL